jgi:hypothetical protein
MVRQQRPVDLVGIGSPNTDEFVPEGIEGRLPR